MTQNQSDLSINLQLLMILIADANLQYNKKTFEINEQQSIKQNEFNNELLNKMDDILDILKKRG